MTDHLIMPDSQAGIKGAILKLCHLNYNKHWVHIYLFSPELNVMEPVKRSGTQCSNSNSSLPSVPNSGATGVGRVASWAVSFERLLEDPLGVHYFTVSPSALTGVFAKQMLLNHSKKTLFYIILSWQIGDVTDMLYGI